MAVKCLQIGRITNLWTMWALDWWTADSTPGAITIQTCDRIPFLIYKVKSLI